MWAKTVYSITRGLGIRQGRPTGEFLTGSKWPVGTNAICDRQLLADSVEKLLFLRLTEKLQAFSGDTYSRMRRGARFVTARDQEPSNQSSRDSRRQLSTAVHPRKNLRSMHFGVFQQNRRRDVEYRLPDLGSNQGHTD